ncbi:MAG TPA: DUF92 domain-containing protein [Vicinamibacterales bacterium]|nr:DUF92 domain-containing protein [Vicinamibacterales bacterium]
MTAHSERARQLVHVSMGAFALLLRYLTWWQAALLAAAALTFNLLVLPRIGRRLYRPGELARGVPAGIVLYPAAVLVLIVAFPARPDIAAAAWGILAAGDGLATLVGRAVRGPRLPWNPEKTVAGLAAFVLFGGIAGVLLALWSRPAVHPAPAIGFSVIAPFAAAIAAGFVESIPVRLDDNIAVPAAAAAVLWSGSIISPDLAANAPALVAERLPLAIGLNAAAAAMGVAARSVSGSGAICGAIIGILIQVGSGVRGWVLLLITFLAATISSRLGLRRKTLLGIAEERGGRRGPGNAIANTGIAAVAAVLSILTPSRDLALVAFVAALTAGASDTLASEIGKAWGRRTYLLTGLRPVRPGTTGAVSMEGTLAGLAGAFGLASAGIALGLIPAAALVPVVLGATAGTYAESALGATLEGPGILNNDVLNFLNTTIAAVTAIVLMRVTG